MGFFATNIYITTIFNLNISTTLFKEELIKIQINLSPKLFNEIYLPYLLDYSKRYNVYYGGRASGKSYFISDKLIIKALNQKSRMLFMLKQDNKIEDTVWSMALNSLQKFRIYDKCKINKSTHTINFPNGSWVKCLGLSEPERIKGLLDIDTVWLEEATNFSVDDFELIDGTVRGTAKSKQLYLSFNPVSKQNWVYTYFSFDTNTIPEDTFILKTTYRDNKWCDEATIKRLERLKEKNPTRYTIEANGDFATLDKLVIPHYEIQNFDWKEKLNSGNRTFLALGCDFGYQDPTAFIASVIDDDSKTLYIFSEHYQKGMLNTDIARMICNKGFRKEKIFFDCAEPKSIQEIKRLGIEKATPCKKGKDSIRHGIQKILQYDLVVHPTCIHIQEEFNNYCYKKDKDSGEYTSEPLDNGYCHLVDALRYSMQIIKKKANILKVKL